MIWWQQRQYDRLHQSAEQIREGVLQDLFALRRQMELAHWKNLSVSTEDLQQMETLYSQVEQVSHRLSSTSNQDDLTLAIQSTVSQWQQHNATPAGESQPVDIKLELHSLASALDRVELADHSPESNPAASWMIHPIVLMVLEQWLQLVGVNLSREASIRVELLTQDQRGGLVLGLQEPDRVKRKAIAQIPELSYLGQAFEVLTEGKACHQHNATQLEWQFWWMLS